MPCSNWHWLSKGTDMFISRFNRFFERHGRWMYLLLGIIISLSFVVFVTPGRVLGRRRGSQPKDAGVMYGETLGRDELLRKIHQTDIAGFLRGRGFMSQNSSQAGQLVPETLKRIRAVREAERRGLDAIGREELVNSVRDMWMFQKDGAFDRERFSAFKQNILRQRGLDGKDFDEILRENIMIDRLENLVAAAVFVGPSEARELFDRYTEEFVVSTADFQAANPSGKDGDPPDADIEAYFTEHREDIALPDSKRARTVSFAAKDYMKSVEVTEADILARYNRLKKSSYKNKELDKVRARIRVSLLNSKATQAAGKAARSFADKLAKRPEKETAAELAERFSALAKEAEFSVVDTGPFTTEGEVPKLGKLPSFQRQAYTLNEEQPLSGVIYGPGKFFVACWLETIPGEVPKELDATVRKLVVDAITTEDAEKLYQEKVIDRFGEALKKVSKAWDLTVEYEKTLAAMADKDEEEKQQLR